MKIAVSVPMGGLSIRDTLATAQELIDQGYQGAWGGEVNGPDFPTVLSAIAATRETDIGVAVAPVQTRATWLLAATAITLSELSGGRFSLGVGPSSEVIVEKWSGVPFTKPLGYVAETVEALRTLLAGEKTTFHGEHIDVEKFPPFATPEHDIPLYVGALNEQSLRQAGRIADGICLNQLRATDVPAIISTANEGRAEGDLAGDELEVMVRVFCLVTDDVAGARDQIRREFAPYVATKVYGRFFTRLGYGDEVAAVQEAFAARDRVASVAAVSDALVDTIAVIGNREQVAERLQGYLDNAVTTLVVDGRGPDREAMMRSFEPGAALARDLVS